MDDTTPSPLPRLEKPLPAHNPNAQNDFEGLRDAIRPALHAIHADHARGMQVEFEQAVIVQTVLHVLMLKGLITREELDQVYPQMQQMMAQLRAQQLTGPRLSQGLESLRPPVDLDCAAHMDDCGTACCTSFSVVLTPEEAASNKYLWDLAFPYRLLVDEAGTCVYLDRNTRRCTIWNDRPSACRTFDCRTDDRIWSSYQGRQLTADAMAAKARLAAAKARDIVR
jgi:Fe-S-cluster containining protein